MVIEVDEKLIENMEEDIQNYINLISRYDSSIKIKNKLLESYKYELNKSKQIIVELTNILLSLELNDEQIKGIQEIKEIIKKDIT